MPTLGRISAVLLLTATAFAGNAGPVFQLPNQPTVYAIQRDTAGNVYLAGAVTAPGRKDLDAFVAKLSSDGRVLFFNTFGGTYSESANALAIASDGSIVTVGVTTSLDFPITSGPVAQNPNLPPPFVPSFGFIAKFDAAGKLTYAAYLNGNAAAPEIFPLDVTLDSSGAAYITGTGALAATGGALNVPTGDPRFVMKLDATGKLVFSTGGIGGQRIALDKQGSIYVAGEAVNVNDGQGYQLPATPGAFQSTAKFAICSSVHFSASFGFPCAHQYVAKLDAAASKLIYATWLTGSAGDDVGALLVDDAGNAILGGSTESRDYPVTPGAYQTTSFAANPPGTDAFYTPPPPQTGYITKLNPGGSGLVFSTFLGGSGHDTIRSLGLDANGRILVTGISASGDFPGLSGVVGGCLPNYITPVPFVTRLSGDGSALSETQLAFGLPSITPAANRNAGVVPSSGLAVVDSNGIATVQDGSLIASIDLAPSSTSSPPALACTTDGADFTLQSHVTPGQLLTLFGSGFDPSKLSVTFNSTPAPVLYASPGQINLQVPYEIAGQPRALMEVRQGDGGTLAGQSAFFVSAEQPSAFVLSAAYATCPGVPPVAALPAVSTNADMTISSCANPAIGGTIVSLYLNGLGLAGAGGQPVTGAISTDATPLSPVVTVTGADFVSLQAVPGAINSVAVLKVKLPSFPITTQSGIGVVSIAVTVDGIALRVPLAVWRK